MVASEGVTDPSGDNPDHAFWRRPAESDAGDATPPTNAPPAPGPPGYTGPPTGPVPSENWRPPVYVQPPPPRRLPAQDPDSIDAEERGARTMTTVVGAVAGVVLLIVTCLLCGRMIP